MKPIQNHSDQRTTSFQHGFTLIELLVAMAIFAMLAVAGWQIMDSISKSRDRVNLQLTQLSDLQYAYLQLSQDFAQTTNYVSVPVGISTTKAEAAPPPMKPTFVLTAQQVDFVRFASPDPRFNPSPLLARVVYVVDNGKLVKQRFYQINNGSPSSEMPNTSVILTDIKDAKWTAFTPKSVDNFPDGETLRLAQQANANQGQNQSQSQNQNQNPTQNQSNPTNPANTNGANLLDLTAYQQLPKGVQLSFTYHDEPVVWRFALPNQAPSVAGQSTLSPFANPNSNKQDNNTQNTNTQNNTANTANTATNPTTVIGRPAGDN